MDKQKKQLIMTIGLVAVLVFVVLNSFGSMKKKKKPRASAPAAAAPANIMQLFTHAPKPVETAEDALLGPQKKRAELPWGRDPFAVISDASGPVSAVTLKGISFGKDGRGYAFINDQIVTVGDTVAGCEVIDITGKQVELRTESRSFYLTFPEE